MDAYNMNTTSTESATGDVKDLTTPKMTKEEVQQKSYAELLQIIQQVQEHTGKDFSDYMNYDFSNAYPTGLKSVTKGTKTNGSKPQKYLLLL